MCHVVHVQLINLMGENVYWSLVVLYSYITLQRLCKLHITYAELQIFDKWEKT